MWRRSYHNAYVYLSDLFNYPVWYTGNASYAIFWYASCYSCYNYCNILVSMVFIPLNTGMRKSKISQTKPSLFQKNGLTMPEMMWHRKWLIICFRSFRANRMWNIKTAFRFTQTSAIYLIHKDRGTLLLSRIIVTKEASLCFYEWDKWLTFA